MLVNNARLIFNNAALFALNFALLKITPEVNLVEERWKKKFSFPSSEWPLNTANAGVLMEVEETSQLFFFVNANRRFPPCLSA